MHQAAPIRVVFGERSLDRVPDEVATLGLRRVLMIAGGAAAAAGDRVAAMLGSRAAGRFDRVAPHVPEPLLADAVQTARSAGADGLCSVGGGSATGLAKAVAVALDLPIVAVPTSYAGSEATAVYGVTGAGSKRTATDPRAQVRTVVYDPLLTVDLPARVTAASAFNALAHAVAALTSRAYHPIAALYAAEAARLLVPALPAALADPGDRTARGELLWGGWLAGSALSAAGTGLHHRLCHVLGGCDAGPGRLTAGSAGATPAGGRHRLVHADLHAVLLPYTLAADEALDRSGLAGLLGPDPVAGLRELAQTAGLPDRLAAIGVPAGELAAAAAEVADRVDRHHPRHGDAAWFGALLADAHHPTEGATP